MKQSFIQTLHDYTGDAVLAQNLSAPMLQCNGMFVPDAMPSIALLIVNFSRPVITNNESAEFNLAGGFQGHVAGAPKNRYDSQLQIIETDTGQMTAFSELMQSNGGTTDGWIYDGRKGRFVNAHRITNVTMTFEALDYDAEGVSTIQRASANAKYNYYGLVNNLGAATSVGQIIGSADGTAEIFAQAKSLLNSVLSGNPLMSAMKNL
ncbi:hypothetical protein [Acinetobacter sp. ANC 3813]|uniref:hypothetical protein n=1 Tax=Acinetobacter sp. ANC 3813 TaxID=1977873 RepID=UPI000A34C903|nr:hypothetical protein [Acinetobacter sp. ANC 3813]OTG87879.1 hypothetical protein B9T34_16210 [Acinetobacter sp. ANC 3813]